MKNWIGIILWFFSMHLIAQHEESSYVPETDPVVVQKLEQWQGFKFGLLMHWGPYSQWGIVESWSICAEDEGWCRRSMDNYSAYKAKYEQLPETFNPVHFNPAEWAEAARKAGMRYVIFTTKHHDGFCMFDSKYTDYKITSDQVPFHSHPKANITLEIFNAFREKGFWTGAYFSKPDWHSNDYWWSEFATPDRNVNYDPMVYPEKWESYVRFTHNQILELMSDYGSIDILWLDGGWVQKLTDERIVGLYQNQLEKSPGGFLKRRYVNQDIRMDELVDTCRKLQPGLIVVDRAVEGPNQNYLTPENRVPQKTLPYPWESCIISGGGWSHTPDAKYMSGQEGIHLLIDIVARGGNLLLNIAPGPDGKWQPGAYELLEEYAEWMEINRESIYDTKPYYPYHEGDLRFTRGRDGAVYLFILADDEDAGLPSSIETSSIDPASIAGMQLLGAKSGIQWTSDENKLTINFTRHVKQSPPCKYARVIKIDMK